MLTEREREILSWIRENPAITQKEIANRAQISRSSVAVHISNLMRKGAIVGRQYVLSDSPYVVVVGGANMDISGRPHKSLISHDSNPGTVSMSAGGAGRNVAHNLALLGLDVRLISAFGDDSRGRELQESCRTSGINVNDSLTIPGASTGSYLAMLDEHGDMELGLSDMAIFDQLAPEALERKLDLLERAAAVVVDTNIPAESIRYLAEHLTTPLMCDPVSTAKAPKIKAFLGRFHTIKPNRLEAEILSGTKIDDEKSLRLAADRLLETGLEQVFISLDNKGLFCANHSESHILPTKELKVVNATGAGDTMMAAIVWSYLLGDSLLEQAQAGMAAAAICVQSETTVSSAISAEHVRQNMG